MGMAMGDLDKALEVLADKIAGRRGKCQHSNKVQVESYYSDTEWCPECGAVRGNNGVFGPKFAWLDWQLPRGNDHE